MSDEKFANGRNIARSECWEYIGEGALRTADYLESKSISELRAICDGLGIEYDTDFTVEELIELIIIEQEG